MRELLVKAVGLHQRGAVAEAEALYRQVLRAFPRNQDALRLCGIACSQQGKDEEAEKLLTKAVQVAPTNADAQNALGKVLNDLGRHEDAEKHCQLALKIKPKFPEAYDNLGNALLASSRAEDAEKAYRKAIALSPKSAAFWSNLGSCLIIAGRYDEAAAAFLEALRLKPNFSALKNLGSILQRVVDTDPVLDAFGRNLGTQDRAPALLLDYSDALIAAGRAAEALPLLEEALKKQPNWPPALFALATAHLELNRGELATACLEEALRARKSDKGTASRLGSLYSRMGDFDEAERWFLEALKHDPDSGFMLYNLASINRMEFGGDLYLKMKRIADDESADPYERARTSFGVADTLDREKRYDEAFVYYARANDLTSVPNIDWETREKNLAKFKMIFTPALYDRFDKARNADSTPIFVIGMPRSGTTL
ncbi:tetratricopeptide repeat protein, partial [Limibacillus halophilus]